MLTPDQIAQQTPNLSNPNLLINGDFRVWQRGTSFTGLTTGVYGADRWCAESSNVDIDIVTNSFDVDGNECHGMKVSNDSDSTLMVGQRIEGLQNVTGKTITVSFEGFSTTASQKLRVYAYYYDNSGVLITSSAINNWVLDTTVAKYTGTVTVPDLSASAINGVGSYMKVRVDTQEVSTTDYTLMKFKLEISPVATPFVPRPIAEELALCQRYYWAGELRNRTGVAVDGTQIYWTIDFPNEMRTVPSVIYSNSPPSYWLGVGIVGSWNGANPSHICAGLKSQGFTTPPTYSQSYHCLGANIDFAFDAEL